MRNILPARKVPGHSFVYGLLLLSLIAALLFGFSVRAAEGEDFVYDYAGLLSQEEKNTLTKKTAELAEKYDMNFVILTTEDAKGKEAAEFADDFYMDQGFYDDGKCGGAIFFIDMDNREVGVETAGDMKDLYITDKRSDAIVDAGYQYLSEKAYGKCFLAMLNATAGYIEDGIVSGKYTYDVDTGEYRRLRRITPLEIGIAFLISIAAGGIACASVIGKYRMKWGSYAYPWREKSKLHLVESEDRFVGQHVTRRRIPRPDGGGGGRGGDSGRTTTHRSSGGGSFGGSSRKF